MEFLIYPFQSAGTLLAGQTSFSCGIRCDNKTCGTDVCLVFHDTNQCVIEDTTCPPLCAGNTRNCIHYGLTK